MVYLKEILFRRYTNHTNIKNGMGMTPIKRFSLNVESLRKLQ